MYSSGYNFHLPCTKTKLNIIQRFHYLIVLHYLFSFVKVKFLLTDCLQRCAMINKDIFEIFKESVSAVLPENAIKDSLSVSKSRLSIQGKTYDLKKYKNIYLFGVGKASIKMAKELEKLLGSFLKGGFVVGTKADNLKRVKTYISDHPVPSKRSIIAGKELKKEMEKLTCDDFFIFMLSGGASSLVEIPKKNLRLSDIQNTTKTLLACGADIKKINMIRKVLSDIKGGELAENIKADGFVVII